jgi:glyoxylase-like metal-dependent hydrolase (beta-lactamase superfamily II)
MKPPIYLRQLAVGPMQNYAYLVGPREGEGCAVVDPGWDAAAILAAAREDGRSIRAVILTHGHFDHVGGVKDLLSAADIPVWVHEADAPMLAKVVKAARAMKDGEKVDAGGLGLQGLHTPGHTPGSQCLQAEGQLFTGDTLFVDCCGRTDLPGSDPAAMHRSLRRLAALPPDTVVWPGHDYGPAPSAPMREVLELNPYLSAADLQAFLGLGA